MLWLLFFLICAGLGYASLRRFDPRDPRTNFDSSHALYHAQVTGDAEEAAPFSLLVHYRYRLLVPMVARPFYLMGNGRLGTWEPGFFGLLMANAIFCSWTTLLLFVLAREVLDARESALVPPLLYLLSFGVSNYHLAGLVDTGEAWALTALVWCLRRERWSWVPLLAVMGTLAKETFTPLAGALVIGWIAADSNGQTLKRAGWLALFGLAGLVTLTVVFSTGNGRLVLPWELERSGLVDGVHASLWVRALVLARERGLVYLFGWLAPLGLFGLRRCPRPWVAGAALSGVMIAGLGIYNGEPGVSRSLFNVLGPLLSLGSAVTLSRLLTRPSLDS